MKKAHLVPSLLVAISALTFTANAASYSNPTSSIPLGVALRDAHLLAANRSDLRVLRVEGDSMLPFFGQGAVLVVKTIAANKLRAGMVAVYTNRFNETVAHGLIEETPSGWIAAGYNNQASDSTPVTAGNLIGVVYATFHSNAAASNLALSTLEAATPVAMTAPAR